MRVHSGSFVAGVFLGMAIVSQAAMAQTAFNFGSAKPPGSTAAGSPAVQGAATGRRAAIGSASQIVEDVRGSLGPGQRRLATADPVYSNERITAANASVGQFQLLDDTRIVVGPGSSIVLDKFIYDPNKSVQEVSINALKGTFRFITGKGRKAAYSIKTPAALMGVRGTIFDFHVDGAGRTSVLLLEGQVNVCGRGGNCQALTNKCEFVQVGRGGRVSQKREVRGGEARGVRVASVFPFVQRQGFLARRFKARTVECAQSTTTTQSQRASISPSAPSATSFGSAPEPSAPSSPSSPGPGNPGNDRGVGAAGENPGGGDFGGGTSGRGDTNGSGGNGASGGGGGSGGNGGNAGGNGNGNAGTRQRQRRRQRQWERSGLIVRRLRRPIASFRSSA
jgi:hypothetical protein